MKIIQKFLGATAALALTAGAALADPALIYDLGGKFDKSFNEAAHNGAEKWKAETGGNYLDIELQSEAQREQALRRFAESGANPIVVTGFAFSSVLSEVAPGAAEEYAEGEGESADRFEKLINIKDRGQIFRVEVESIEYVEAAGDYMCIYTGDNSLILRETMKDLERRLDPRRFQRVHRSAIVNLDQVRQVKPHTNGECFLVLDSGAEVKVSRSYRDVVARFVH